MTIKNSTICNGAKVNSQSEIFKSIIAPDSIILEESKLAANSVIGEKVKLACNDLAGPVVISDIKSVSIILTITFF